MDLTKKKENSLGQWEPNEVEIVRTNGLIPSRGKPIDIKLPVVEGTHVPRTIFTS